MKLRMEKMRLNPSTGLMRWKSGLIGSPVNTIPFIVMMLVSITQPTVIAKIGKAVASRISSAVSMTLGQTVAKGSV